MTHEFDTGMADPQRTVVRRGVAALLAPLRRAAGGYLHEARGFGGITRTYTDEEGIQQLVKSIGAAPSIGIATATRTFETLALGGKQAKSDLEVMLYFVSQHGRDGLIGRHEADSVADVDPTADPGLDVMMEHAIELVHGQYVAGGNATIKQLFIREERELVTTGRVTIWVQTYSIRLFSMTGSKEFRTAEQMITSLHSRVTTNPDEPNRPADAEDPTTIDADHD